MAQHSFKPEPRYRLKLYAALTLTALLILAGGALVAAPIAFGNIKAALITFAAIAILDVVWWLPAMLLIGPYYHSLRYEIQEDEVIVHAGVITHSVKHVPYRTVTNLTVKRDILDRWFFNLGSLNIQTAGMSGQSGAEEVLAGLENVQEVYEMVVAELRRYRGAMSPTAADMDAVQEASSGDSNGPILNELRKIRRLLEIKQ